MRVRGWFVRLAWTLGWFAAVGVVGWAQPGRLLWSGPDESGRLRFTSSGPSNQVHRLEVSTDLRRWSELARALGGLQDYPDLNLPGQRPRFYRVRIAPPAPEDDGLNQVRWGDDPFLSEPGSPGSGQPRWIKFTFVLAQPDRVWFQDSRKYTFHYDYAVARLAPFRGLSREEFDAVTLRRSGQQAVVGAVLWPPATQPLEAAIQFSGQEPFPIEQVADWFERVRAVLPVPPGARVYYMPAYEQAATARDHLAWLAGRGIEVRGPEIWAAGDACYAPGWALGRLVWVPAAAIAPAYATGRLGPEDILATDAVPAEVPPVAGVLSLSPATPNSHVAILARSFGIPFGWIADADRRAAVPGWDGRIVMYRVIESWNGCRVDLAPVEGEIDAELMGAISSLKNPPPLALPPWQPLGAIWTATDSLGPADVPYVGGKAAHFGLLRRAIPDHSPTPAIAFTLDLWNAYLDQPMPWGGTLRQAIAARLSPFTWPPDMGLLQGALREVRDWITDVADFTQEQRAAVLEALGAAGFDPQRRLRFRSSTNVEDTERFTGAGLYDSFSGCLADELDSDDAGPSHCDPARTHERGVFRAMRKVYASFYNDNAFLERLRHGVDERTVGMGLLVHYSTPDEIEWANGVARLSIRRMGSRSVEGELVTQKGAVSVANPDSTARPERVRVSAFGQYGPFLEVIERFSLVPLGGTVLAWEEQYRELYGLLDRAARAYEAEFPELTAVELDFEYKLVAPGRLLVKQIRRVPVSDPSEPLPAYFLAIPAELTVLQGEFGNVFANHRLKSVWRLHSRHTALRPENLQETLHPTLELTFASAEEPRTWHGPMRALPGYRFTRLDGSVEDAFDQGTGAAHRRLRLQTPTPGTRSRREGPLVTLADLTLVLRADYATPQPILGWNPRLGTTQQDVVRLGVVEPISSRSLLQTREAEVGGIRVETSFYWPPEPTGAVAGYTAPLQAWVQTRISGLIDQPLVLRDPMAQTYHPGHHNFFEEFVFEPGRDPAVPAAARVALEARNIRALVAVLGLDTQPQFYLWTLDNRLQPWAGKP